MRLFTNNNNFGSSINGLLFAQIWKACVLEYLSEYTYLAESASLDFNLNVGTTYVDFKWTGFNDSLDNFVNGIFQRVAEMKD